MTQAATDARNAAMHGAAQEYAHALATYRELLPSLYPEKPGFKMPSPAGDNYQRMAEALLRDGQVRVQGEGGEFIDIITDKNNPNSLGHRDRAQGGILSKAAGSDLDDLAGSARARSFADATEAAVENNSSDIGFLRGASIMNALSGLIQWIFGGFKGGLQGLRKTIAGVTAENIRSDLADNLRAKGFSHDEVKNASDAAYYATLEKAGFPDPKAPKKTSLENVTAYTLDDTKVAEMRGKVYNAVLNPPGSKSLGTQVGEQLVEEKRSSFLSNHFGWVRGVSEDGLMQSGQKMAENIAGSIADFTTNPDSAQALARLGREPYAAAVADHVAARIEADQHSFGLPKAIKPEQLAAMREKIRASVADNYATLRTASALAATNVREPSLVASKTEQQAREAAFGARNAGMTGGDEAHEAGAGSVPKALAQAGKAKGGKPAAAANNAIS